jgi:hypothetical protein
MRGWINDARSYLEPVKIGDAMRASGLGTVIAAGPGSKLRVGDIVSGTVGWQEYVVLSDKELQVVMSVIPVRSLLHSPNLSSRPPKGAIPLDFLGPLGHIGLTAYFVSCVAHRLLLRPTHLCPCRVCSKWASSREETPLLSVVLPERPARSSVKWVRRRVLVSSPLLVVKRNANGSRRRLASTRPSTIRARRSTRTSRRQVLSAPYVLFLTSTSKLGYLDVYFDNVGGEMLEFMLTRLNKDARIVLCGSSFLHLSYLRFMLNPHVGSISTYSTYATGSYPNRTLMYSQMTPSRMASRHTRTSSRSVGRCRASSSKSSFGGLRMHVLMRFYSQLRLCIRVQGSAR